MHARRDRVAAVGVASAFSRVAGSAVSVPVGLADRVERLRARRCLEFIGLARRAGKAVAGFEKVRGLVSRGHAGVVLLELITDLDAEPRPDFVYRSLSEWRTLVESDQ